MLSSQCFKGVIYIDEFTELTWHLYRLGLGPNNREWDMQRGHVCEGECEVEGEMRSAALSRCAAACRAAARRARRSSSLLISGRLVGRSVGWSVLSQ